MKPILITLLLTFGITAAQAQTPEEQSVLAPVHATFAAMAKHDPIALQQAFLPGGTIVSTRNGKATQVTFADFADHIAKLGDTRLEERIHDPVIHIDNDLALIWAPFEVLIDGKMHSCGTDLFTLIRQDGKWLITTIDYNNHSNCPAN